jgi:hypothetical protein
MSIGKAPPPGSNFALQEGRWLLGLASGSNRNVQSAFTAHSGGGKASAFQLPAAVAFLEVDTVAADHDSVLLPSAQAGTIVCVANNGAHILDFYGRASDTINAAATANAYSINANTNAIFFCVKTGAWFALHAA